MLCVSGDLTDNNNDIGTLPQGKWVCVPIYPLNLDLVCAPNANNHIIVSSKNYRGAVIVGCYSVD